MNRNIIIIAAIAVVAFLAVLLIPRMLDRAASGDEEEVASSEDDDGDAEEGRVGSDSGDLAAADATPANPQLAAELAAAAQQVNAAGPVRIDEITMMTRAEAIGNRIRYRYEVSETIPPAQVQALGANLRQQNQNVICSRSETRALIDMGGEIEYAYYGPGNTFMFSTPIVDC